MCANMDFIILRGPLPTPNGITKPHITRDHWLEHKEALTEDIWKDLKLQSPPPPLQPPPASTQTILSALPPPPPPPPISVQAPPPPPPLIQPIEPLQGNLDRGEILNLKNSLLTKERQGMPTSNSNISTRHEYGSSYGEDKTQLAAPDLESMDEIWHGEFSKVFAPYLPHIWYLSPTDMCPSPRWRRFKDSAKVRFCCQTCGHGWTSMKGRVVFWYFLHLPFCEGYVQFKLYGQQCMRCNNGIFEPAMWYPEEVNKVLCNLYNRIGQTYYGFVKPPIRYDRRAGKPRTQHNAALCQACRDGECDSRPRTGPATPGPPHGVLTPTPTKIPPPTVTART